jgi:heme o synthase
VLKDFGNLIKFKVNVIVVFTSIIGYLIASKGHDIDIFEIIGLGLGGFFTTGAAHAINQILERKYDIRMERTKDRPLPAGRMNVKEVIIYAIMMIAVGYFSFNTFNNGITLFLGMFSLVFYSFIYTPMKRVNSTAVAFGAVPGALPPAIGYIAYTNHIDKFTILLFIIQFVWQFPHFWSIAWIYFDDYKNGGYKLMPVDNFRSKNNAKFTFISALILLPFIFLILIIGAVNIFWFIPIFFITVFFMLRAYFFYRNPDDIMAKKLMLSSIIYLPVLLIIILVANLTFN